MGSSRGCRTPHLRGQAEHRVLAELSEARLKERLLAPVMNAEPGHRLSAGSAALVGTGAEIEASTYDCFAMTSYYAGLTSKIHLVTAVDPEMVLPGPVASGWHESEFAMFGADFPAQDERHARSSEFIQVFRGAWANKEVSFRGRYY